MKRRTTGISFAIASLAIPWVLVANWTGHWTASVATYAVTMPMVFLLIRSVTRPAPYQLVLRLADDDGGDQEDARSFKLLHKRFKQLFPKSETIGFEGFDTDGIHIWFYFHGPDDASVKDAVLSQLHGCRIRKGSYFVSGTRRSFASEEDGSTLQLADSVAQASPLPVG